MNIVAPCPVCGKHPVVKTKGSFGEKHVIIRCKPLLEKAHFEIIIYEGSRSTYTTVEEAILAWNKAICEYKLTNERKTK